MTTVEQEFIRSVVEKLMLRVLRAVGVGRVRKIVIIQRKSVDHIAILSNIIGKIPGDCGKNGKRIFRYLFPDSASSWWINVLVARRPGVSIIVVLRWQTFCRRKETTVFLKSMSSSDGPAHDESANGRFYASTGERKHPYGVVGQAEHEVSPARLDKHTRRDLLTRYESTSGYEAGAPSNAVVVAGASRSSVAASRSGPGAPAPVLSSPAGIISSSPDLGGGLFGGAGGVAPARRSMILPPRTNSTSVREVPGRIPDADGDVPMFTEVSSSNASMGSASRGAAMKTPIREAGPGGAGVRERESSNSLLRRSSSARKSGVFFDEQGVLMEENLSEHSPQPRLKWPKSDSSSSASPALANIPMEVIAPGDPELSTFGGGGASLAFGGGGPPRGGTLAAAVGSTTTSASLVERKNPSLNVVEGTNYNNVGHASASSSSHVLAPAEKLSRPRNPSSPATPGRRVRDDDGFLDPRKNVGTETFSTGVVCMSERRNGIRTTRGARMIKLTPRRVFRSH